MQGPPQSDGFDDEGGMFGEINITPLTDVFLVLLIILMVVSSSIVEDEKEAAYEEGRLAEKALAVMTPQGVGDSELVPEDLVISITAEQRIFVGEVEVPMKTLDAFLIQVQKKNPLTRVVLRGDEKLSYATVMDILRRCTDSGLSNVALASRE